MWANCGSVFNSLSDLVGHVNLQHLCSIDSQSHLALQSQHNPQTLSCHWGDCAVFPSPSAIPGSSTACSDDNVLNILIAHLMQDHLGLNPSATLLPPLPDSSDAVSQPPVSPHPPSHDCSGTHVCKWKACTQTFSSCDDLTAHIASVHIGAGKAHYECFWEDCARHGGTNGFSSKQKISRHIQVRVSPHFIPPRSRHSLVTHRPPTLSVPGMQSKLFRGSNTPATHAASYTRE